MRLFTHAELRVAMVVDQALRLALFVDITGMGHAWPTPTGSMLRGQSLNHTDAAMVLDWCMRVSAVPPNKREHRSRKTRLRKRRAVLHITKEYYESIDSCSQSETS